MAKAPLFLKNLYSACLAHPWLMRPIREGRILPQSVYQHLYVKGKFKVEAYDGASFMVHSDGYYVETLLYWGGVAGGWEKESLKVWFKLAQQAKYIVDVGANTGIYSLVAASAHPQATVYAFEPIERVYQRLVKNIGLNSFHILSFPLACGSSVGEAVIYDSPLAHNYEASLVRDPHQRATSVIETKIAIDSLDNLLDKGALKGIDLIKIDVERYEPEVLAGFKKLAEYLPDMLIEILDEEVAQQIEAQIGHLPYLYFNISEKNGPRRTDNLAPSDTFNYLICKESSAAYLGLL